jgi:carbon-monoxide dehydrogenase medium subunit
LRLAQPAHLVDINGVAGLDRIEVIDGELVIGACVRHSAFERVVVDGPLGVLLKQVVHHIAHYPIRTRGTFCGSIAHADPASEWCLLTATLGARLRARSVRGERLLTEPGFFEGMMATALAPDELLLETRLSLLSVDTRAGFNEFNCRPGDFAIAIVEPRLGVGAVEAQPRRITAAEAVLDGQPPTPQLFAEAAALAAQEVEPLDQNAETADYKRDVVRAVVARALAGAEGSHE